MRCSSSMRSVDDARCSLKRRSSIRSSQTVSFPKKNAKHEVLQFSRIWCNGPVGTAVTARVSRGECDGGLSFTTICTAHVSATAQATYRRCLPWAAAVRRESSVASNERVRDSILLTRHLPFSITSSPFLAIFRNALTDTSGGGAASAELRTTQISGD